MYEYNSKLVRVIDGDTVVLDVDLGFTVHVTVTVRILGINAPEITGVSKIQGIASKDALEKILNDIIPDKRGNKNIVVKSFMKDKYGRWLSDLLVNDTNLIIHSVSNLLVERGFATLVNY